MRSKSNFWRSHYIVITKERFINILRILKHMAESNFQNYQISAEQTGPEERPVRVTLPLRAILDNSKELQVYRGQEERFPELRSRGLPIDLDWEGVLTELVLPYAKFPDYLVDKVNSIRIEGENLSLDCIASDPDYGHI